MLSYKTEKPEVMYKKRLLSNIQKLVDFNINVIPSPKLSSYYQGWIDELESGYITGQFKKWISIQIDYYREKERGYAKYLESLITSE